MNSPDVLWAEFQNGTAAFLYKAVADLCNVLRHQELRGNEPHDSAAAVS